MHSMDINSTFPVAYVNATNASNAFLVAQGTVIDCEASDLSEVVLRLLQVYYVLDLNYPKSHSGVLGFFQMMCIKDSTPFHMSARFPRFVEKFKCMEEPAIEEA